MSDLAENDPTRAFLFPGEKIVWTLDVGGEAGVFHKGPPRESYAITNQRVLAVDRAENKLIASLPLSDTDLIVIDRHSASGRRGVSLGGFARLRRTSGRSQRLGTLVFTSEGIRKITLPDVADPRGVKELFMSVKRALSPNSDGRREMRRERRRQLFSDSPPTPGTNKTMAEKNIINSQGAKLCHNCGAQLSSESRFCNRCGTAQS